MPRTRRCSRVRLSYALAVAHSLANLSTNSFIGFCEWPFTQCHSTWLDFTNSFSFFQRSTFFTFFLQKCIKSLNIKLPEPKAPVGAYVATKIVGKLLYISGQISIDENAKLITGKIGKDLDLEKGYKAAERCGLSIVAQVKKACEGDLSKIKS